MKKTISIIVLALFLLSINLSAQSDEWKKDLERILYEFMSCGGPTAPSAPCNEFLAKALKRVYNIPDFDKPNGKYMIANEIGLFVSYRSDLWTLLGKGSDQNALNEAQGYANLNKAVIAVYPNPSGMGHVALVLPGNLTMSGSWGLSCPNSASFFINKPSKAFISKPLSFAFDPSLKVEVLIYGRNY